MTKDMINKNLFANTDIVSEGAILRDYYDIGYVNAHHKMLVELAGGFYGEDKFGIELPPDELAPCYKDLYDLYGQEYFIDVIWDMKNLDKPEINKSLLLGKYDRDCKVVKNKIKEWDKRNNIEHDDRNAIAAEIHEGSKPSIDREER